MALINPHPALKVSVPMNPMVDGWMGDDWFHNGAFRQQNLPYITSMSRLQRERMKPSGGPATMTTSICTWKPDRPANSPSAAVWK
jgi:predicted acyl esterase